MNPKVSFSFKVDKLIKKYNIPENKKFWDKKLINYLLKIKLSSIVLANLYACYKRPCRNIDLIGCQPAKPCQTLRDYGFVFRQDNKNYTFKHRGEIYRQIIGFNPKNVIFNANINSGYKNIYIFGKQCEIMPASKAREVDHRTPVSRLKNLNIIPPTFDISNSEDTNKEFQCLSTNVNCQKREVCKKCLEQEGQFNIQDTIPNYVKNKELYIKYQSPKAKSCLGCFWHSRIYS